jgi:hypothetical protein
MSEVNRKRESIYLEPVYRNWVFLRAYTNIGSLSGIASHFHYIASAGKNGAIRDMWIGKKGIPAYHITELCNLAEVTVEGLEQHRVERSANVEQSDWMRVAAHYGQRVPGSFQDFRNSFQALFKQIV